MPTPAASSAMSTSWALGWGTGSVWMETTDGSPNLVTAATRIVLGIAGMAVSGRIFRSLEALNRSRRGIQVESQTVESHPVIHHLSRPVARVYRMDRPTTDGSNLMSK